MTFRAKLLNLLLPGLLFACGGVARAAEPFEEGVHYERLPIPVASKADAPIVVYEVFSYGCIHCRNFDPFVEAWREALPEDVSFQRVPAAFYRGEPLARAYYTAELLGVLDKVHEPIFRAIHEHRADLRNPELMAALFEAAAGVSVEDFTTAYESWTVDAKVRQGQARINVLPSSNVPAMIVAGRYWLNGRHAGSNPEMLPVVDHLIGLERERRGGSEAAAPTDAGVAAADAD